MKNNGVWSISVRVRTSNSPFAVETEFRQLGRRDARDLAVALFAGIQGAALLATTFRDPTIHTRQTHHLERWIDTLTPRDT